MKKEYPCELAKNRNCNYGGNKYYNYGFLQGIAQYCRKSKTWIANIKICPLQLNQEKNPQSRS